MIRADISTLVLHGASFDPASFDWGSVKSAGLLNHCQRVPKGKNVTCGNILSHSRRQVKCFRETMGVQVCCFKIGITSNPVIRFAKYREKNYTSMWVIHSADCIGLISMLEAALIAEFGPQTGCQNKLESGGEGALNKASPPLPPYFAYVAGGRADQPRNVG